MYTKHTPGPWKTSQESIDPDWAIVTANAGNIVANVNRLTGPDIAPLVSTIMPHNANAALVAAAPELFDAATAIYNLSKDAGPNVTGPIWRDMVCEIASKAKNAIDKAIGEE